VREVEHPVLLVPRPGHLPVRQVGARELFRQEQIARHSPERVIAGVGEVAEDVAAFRVIGGAVEDPEVGRR
jgi:hypothetical protein